jgi:hypothetical protein
MDFALITEGVTDQIALMQWIRYYLKDDNLLINALQPHPDNPMDAGWSRVLNYLASNDFQEFLDNDTRTKVVIQIDTDVSFDWGVANHHANTSDEQTIATLRDQVIERLIQQIGLERYENNRHRIFFAVCIHDLECWILLFYTTGKNEQQKIAGCIKKLNDYLNPAHGFTIDAEKKQRQYYEKIFAPKNRKRFSQEGLYVTRYDMRSFFQSLLPNT